MATRRRVVDHCRTDEPTGSGPRSSAVGHWRSTDVADLKKGARITGTQRDKLATDLRKKYEKGASIRALAEQTGRSYGFVHRVLSETGVTLRGRGGATRSKKK
nr:helix-turn-helix domain-containing protein [Pseudonocardia acidicola]